MPFKVYNTNEAGLETKLNEIQASGENVVQVVPYVMDNANTAFFKVISISMAPWKQEPTKQDSETPKQEKSQ